MAIWITSSLIRLRFVPAGVSPTSMSLPRRCVSHPPSYWLSMDGRLDPDQPRPSRKLARADQRAAVEAGARLLPADIAAVQAPAVELLALRIIFALVEVEPDHGIAGAMPLRLILIAKGRQGERRCTHRAHEHRREAQRTGKQIGFRHRRVPFPCRPKVR